MNAALKHIKSLLRERIGLDVETLSAKALDQVLRERIQVTGLQDVDAYWSLLSGDDGEVDHLINAVVVPETWFFRDSEPFEFLKNFVTHEWLPLHAGQHLRVLSIPCSTGEEPYSIAMALMDIHLEPGFFLIDAVDISQKALDKAQSGLYTRHSFRGVGQDQLQRYFQDVKGRFQLCGEIRSSVRFICGNALEFAATQPACSYDVIFCRNLLIYLDEASRRKLVSELDRLLAGDGAFFLGHAEAPCVFLPGYDSVQHSGSFAARKKRTRPVKAQGGEVPWVVRQPESRIRMAAAQKSLAMPIQENLLPSKAPDAMDEARQYADQGLYDQAGKVCQSVLQGDPGCDEAYYMLGLVALAQGKDEAAAENFQKAVYLDPENGQALAHLSLLMDKQGRKDQAARYRRMADRVNEKSAVASGGART
ncbi:MAG: CheR family methyltransferase [Lentisphaerota bacterium]